MSIIAYAGLPGSGKTYSAVENVILPALKAGRVVCHNLKLYEDAISEVTGGTGQLVQLAPDATPDEIIEGCPPGAVIVIDEIWRYWPAGVKVSQVDSRHLSFFKEHRQRVGEDSRTTEILIIDQDLGSAVPAWLRSLIELTYLHEKLSAAGMAKRFRVDLYRRAQSAERPSPKAHVRTMYGTYKPEVYSCYQSHAKQNDSALGEAGLEEAVDDRASIWKRWDVRAYVLIGLLTPFIWAYAINGFLSFGESAPMSASADIEPTQPKPPQPAKQTGFAPLAPRPTEPEPAAQPAEQPQEVVEPQEPPYSTLWRLHGVVVRADGSGRALVGSYTGKRYVDVSECERNDSDEWVCLVEGERVARWTGGSAGSLNAAAPDGTYKSASDRK